MWNPLVSIIIPVYNGSNYLREAINSALAQTYKNIEVLVINDGSDDDGATERIALSYGEKIRYFAKKNGGAATALNLGIEEMRGEYFSWLSHDDLYHSIKVERQIRTLAGQKNRTKIVYSDYDILDMRTQHMMRFVLKQRNRPSVKYENSIYPILEGLVHGCSLLIHTSHFQRVGKFNEDLKTTQDYDLWFRMFRHQRLLYLEESLIIGREHREQGSKLIQNHLEECNALYLGFVKVITEQEAISLYGSVYAFYYQMLRFAERGDLQSVEQYCLQQLQQIEEPQYIRQNIGKIQAMIRRCSGGKALPICIFGAGRNGRWFIREFRRLHIGIQYVCDNDENTWGTMVENVDCIAPHLLEEMKNDLLVIVSANYGAEIYQQLSEMKAPYVIEKHAMDHWLEQALREDSMA